jgi:glycosyltransferase involved in cell wall biosynthesis
MRIALYSHPAFIESSLSLARELSKTAEVHLFLEVAPEAWQTAAFELQRARLAPGLHPAAPILARQYPAAVQAYWRDLASFTLVVHSHRRAVHPGSLRLSDHVVRHIQRLAPDILHIDDPDVSPRLALGIRSRRWDDRVPIVLSVHDPKPHSGEDPRRKALTRRLLFPRVSRFVVHSAALAQPFVERHGLDRGAASVVPLGVYRLYEAWATPGLAPADRTVLFFGRLSAYKGLSVLYEALPIVAGRVDGIHVDVAGEPVPGYHLPSAPRLNNGGTLRVSPHYIDNSRLAGLVQRASVVVCPYIDATQSGVVLTSYGLGRPVIGSTAGGLPEYIREGQTGLLVPPGDPAALAAAIERVLVEEGLQARLSAGVAALRDGDLDWATIGECMTRIYAEVLDQRAAATF